MSFDNLPALPPDVRDVIREYKNKLEDIDVVYEAFKNVEDAVKGTCSVLGTWGDNPFVQSPYLTKDDMVKALRKSAWRSLANVLSFEEIATEKELKAFEYVVDRAEDFTFENILKVFKKSLENPRETVLRGLAEQFSNLDPAFKSHNKVKLGTEGLPKRVVLKDARGWGVEWSYGARRVYQFLKPLMRLQGKIVPSEDEIRQRLVESKYGGMEILTRGISFRKFKNGNLHVFFDDDNLKALNMFLAEYYGNVLPDAYTKDVKPSGSNLPAKDLQFYRTPDKVADIVVGYLNDNFIVDKDTTFLEPSAGDGSLVKAILRKWPEAVERIDAIEIHPERSEVLKKTGVVVMNTNFLEVDADTYPHSYDVVVMNPPFYGAHWAKHIEKAIELMKDDAILVSILPATAWIENRHLLPSGGKWYDLPVGSFKESGTGVNTGVFIYRQRKN